METWSNLIGVAGTIAFAVTAVLALKPRGIDLFGASVLAIITAVGGGTLRDMITNAPVFWASSEWYIWVALASAIAAFYTKSFFETKRMNKLMLYFDAAGISLFAIQAVQKVWDQDFGIPVAPVILGVLTAIGGGLIRDVLAGRPNLLLSKDLYAIPVLIGCILYSFILSYLPEYHFPGSILCILVIFLIRVAAFEKNLKVPVWLYSNNRQNN
jgi:uncharacterized membrane protein YeiH